MLLLSLESSKGPCREFGECCDRHDAGQREKAVMRQDSNWNTPHWLTAETIATVTRTLSLLHDGLTSGHSY